MATTQLEREELHTKNFIENICPLYGLLFVEAWGSGSRNKKENCDADITVKVMDEDLAKKLKLPNIKLGCLLTVSLKTKGGNFTLANGGTGNKC